MRVWVLALALAVGGCGGKSVTSSAGDGVGRNVDPGEGGSGGGGAGGGGPVSRDAGGSWGGETPGNDGGVVHPTPNPQPTVDGAACLGPLASTRESYVPPNSCAAPESNILGPVATIGELHALLLGEWLLCGATSVFGSKDEIGIELIADGQWFKLYPDGNGGVQRGQGPDRQGTFEALDNGDAVQLNLTLASGVGAITTPQFSINPRKVRLNNNGVFKADYVSNDAEGRCAPGTSGPTPGKYTPPASCALEPTLGPQPPGVDGVRAALSGRWALCNSPSTFGTRDEAGLELTTDGEFFKLYMDQNGVWVRGQGFEKQGTYSLLGSSGHVQLNLEIAGSGTVITIPQFGSSPRALRLNNNGAFEGRYVAIEP